MAFAYTVEKKINVERTWALAWGTFTNGATDAGGDIVTGFSALGFFVPSINSHVGTESVKHTISGGTVTIVTSEGADGTWFAVGV